MKRKGFYIKKSETGLYLNIFKPDFVQYINDQQGEWIKFSIYEKLNDPKGFSHNMEIIQQRKEDDKCNNVAKDGITTRDRIGNQTENQTMLADKTLDKLIEKRKENRGGPRPGSGRKRKLEEEEIIQRLDPMAPDVFKQLHNKIKEGDMKAIQLFCAYYIGLPTQKIESKIEGNLNQIAIEIIKPNILLQDNRTVQIDDKDNM